MCKLGDIIVVDGFRDENGNSVPRHSFVVINDEPDYVEGLRYDFVSNMMCSFHDEEHKNKKLRFEENFPIKEELISGSKINNKEGYIKADQLFYFDKKNISYKIIAHMDSELLDDLVQLILVLNEKGKLKQVVTNLSGE